MIKFILLSLIILNSVWVKAEIIYKPYPGKHAMSECVAIWESGYYNLDVISCEKHINNPKFKFGDVVKYKTIGSNCWGIIYRATWSSIKNIPIYLVEVKCKNTNSSYDNYFSESSLIKEKRK